MIEIVWFIKLHIRLILSFKIISEIDTFLTVKGINTINKLISGEDMFDNATCNLCIDTFKIQSNNDSLFM